ncbi:hypothetical protein [Streptomyces genisteinicus]|uniref:Uncharacterized protein n=1 Tax=Streptomyces genisteinicus TaxID=2768068 RepID=A0A7H0I5B0_9ACTN|nr:hypothetical protein [Streptomyces genisteinicus]QNP67976.1 hypothetical protein IAG43_33980 [Streptomyces genisteinicus]
MTNKLIAAGKNRLQKAEDSRIDPAVPAELQVARESIGSAELNPFAGGRVLGADDVTGTPEEQLAFVTGRLVEIDSMGSRAEDFVTLNKGALLEVARDRELHVVAGESSFARWAAGVLDIEEKYVFELVADAARIRAVGALGPELSRHLTRASARKYMASVISDHGVELARTALERGVAEAAAQGKRRPTVAMLTQATQAVTAIEQVSAAPAIPTQGQGSEISDPPASGAGAPAVAAELGAIQRAVGAVQERAFRVLAPGAVRAAAASDPVSLVDALEALETELEKAGKRLTAARQSAAAALEAATIPKV